MTNLTVGRFQVITASMMKMPSKCSTCGSFSNAHGKEYVDFGLWVEFYGNVYICTECFLGAAAELGVVPVVQFNEAIIQINEYKAVVKTLIEENGNLRHAVDSLRTLDRPDPASLNYCNHDIIEQTTAELEPETIRVDTGNSEFIEQPGSDDTELAGREEGPTQQDNVRGSENLRNDDFGFSAIGLEI